jgi:hypothetical protein
MSIDEQFIYNFKKNGGKFYTVKIEEIKEQFENILQENDWYESTVLCYEPKLFNILENKLSYEKSSNPKFFFPIRKSNRRRRVHLILFQTKARQA